MSKNIVIDSTRSVYRTARLGARRHMADGSYYDEGHLATEWGYVTLFRYKSATTSRHQVQAEFIYNGKWHRRIWERPSGDDFFSERSAGLLARAFAKEVVKGTFNP